MQIPDEAVQAHFDGKLFAGPADAKFLLVRRSAFGGFLAGVFANELALGVENFESDLLFGGRLQRVIDHRTSRWVSTHRNAGWKGETRSAEADGCRRLIEMHL